MKVIKLISLSLVFWSFVLVVNASDGIPPDYKPITEIYEVDGVDTEAAYDALAVYRNYFRLQGEGYTKASLLEAFISETEKALNIQPKNSHLLYIKGYSHELYIGVSGRKITGEERKHYKSTRDESFLKALEYDGQNEVFLTKKMLWMMLTRINGEVAIKSAERYIERYSKDHDYHDRLPLLEVYSYLGKNLARVGRIEEAKKIGDLLHEKFGDRYSDFVVNRIKSIDKIVNKKSMEEEQAAKKETASESDVSHMPIEEGKLKDGAPQTIVTPEVKRNLNSELEVSNNKPNIQELIREYGPIVAIIIVVLLYLRSRRNR